MPSIRFDVLTLFPDLFQGYTSQSLVKLAIQRGSVRIDLWNIRDWSANKHQTVDDRPFGGGPGMVLMVEPMVSCVEAVQAKNELPGKVVMLTPAGRRLTQAVVAELAEYPRLLLLCGRYEGFDDRIRQRDVYKRLITAAGSMRFAHPPRLCEYGTYRCPYCLPCAAKSTVARIGEAGTGGSS